MPPQFRKALHLATVCLQEYRVSDDAEEKAIMLRYIGLTLWEYSWLVLLFAALMGIFMFLMRKTIIVVSRLIEYDLRKQVFGHYEELDSAFYNRTSTGDMMSRITEDVSKVRMYLGPGLLYCINLVTLFILAISSMYRVNPTLTMYALIPLPILSISIYYVSSVINKRSTVIQTQLAKLNTVAQEVYSGIRVIKSYTKEDKFRQSFAEESDLYLDNSMSLARVNAFFRPLMLLLVSLSVLLVVIVGGHEVAKGNITHGNIAEFIIYVNMLTWPFTAIGWIVSIIQQAEASQARIMQFMKTKPTIVSESDEDLHIEGQVRFDKVHLTYADSGTTALEDVSFQLEKGEILGIIGRTASGKSTIASLLLRMLDPQQGTVYIDNKDIKTLNLSQLRQRIGYVPQDAFLFSDTIGQNVAFGEENLDIDRVKFITAKAAVHDDIMALPKQYETVVGERGVTLSGGQKQRVALARALIKDPDIIILDDCLSAVDTTTEQTILGYLDGALSDKTSIIITHRIYKHLEFDKVIVLDEGRVIEAGTPDQLMKQQGYYYDILTKQTIDEENMTPS